MSTAAERRICVVGAGVAGLAALKVIKERPEYINLEWSVTVYERQSQLGGVWRPSPPEGDPPLTPLYDSVTTNLPHPVMAYTDFVRGLILL